MQLLRLVFVLPAIVVGLAISSRPALQRRVDILTFVIFAACAGFIVSAAFLDKGYNSPYSYVLVMMLVGVGFVTLWPWKLAVAFTLVVYGMYWIPILIGKGGIEDATDFIGYQLFIFGMIVVILVSQQLRLRLEKGAFLSRLQLDQLKTDFFANVSHELRTPLTLSLGPLQSLLKKGHAADEEQHLQALHRNQLRLLGLINQLLDLSKAESGGAQVAYSRHDIGALVRAIAAEVDNAVRTGAENLWIELKQVDKYVSVAVSDDGPGVSPDVVHRIFDPFFTTRAEGEGTGLGLHLSRRIAQECGGELRYEPRPGGGGSLRDGDSRDGASGMSRRRST